MCTYFKTEIDVAQNPLDEFFSNFDWQKTFPQEGFQVKKNKGVRGYFLKKNKRKFCMQNLTKERKQPPVVILQQVVFYNVFVLAAKNQKIRSRCLVDEFSFADIFQQY